MTNPPQGPGAPDDSQWAQRPPQQPPVPPQQPPVDPTLQLPRQDPEVTIAIQRAPQPAAPQPVAPPPVAPQPAAPRATPAAVPAAETPEEPGRIRRLLSDPLSIGLVIVIVIALGFAGLVGGELYTRHRADQIVSAIVGCVVKDDATASFATMPPFLWQHFSRNYSEISVETAGNQIRDASGMKLNLVLHDVSLSDNGDSAGTVGSMVADVDWSTDGIKKTVQNALPLVGSMVSSVTTNPSAGTITVDGGLATIVAAPKVVDGGLTLQVVSLSGLGMMLPKETVQPLLDAATSDLTKDYPMGIKADTVQVTDTGVTGQFSTQNATIPLNENDPCFVGL